MVDQKTIHQLIDEAIITNTTVYIRYRDNHGNISTREISPLEWVESGKILALCHLRNEQRNFNISNIVEMSKEPLGLIEPSEPSVALESQVQAVEARPITRANHSPQSGTSLQLFTRVTDDAQWNRLLGYYRECLDHEYQQQFSMSKGAIRPIYSEKKDIYSFLSGKVNLEFRLNRQDGLRDFLDPSRNRNKQLCLGKSFVCLD